MEKETLYQLWMKRNPYWEKRYQDILINPYSDYGRGATQYNEDRGKIFGGGYELFIIAFFLGLYLDQRKPITTDTSKKKTFGFPIQQWGNLESRNKRIAYGEELRKYIFAALVSRTNVDFIALDKGELSSKEVVDALMKTMEEYANGGFRQMAEMVDDNPNVLFKEGAFLDLFLPFITGEKQEEEELESLD